MTGAKWRVMAIVLGIGLGAASLIGANRLLHQPDSVGGGGAAPARDGGPPLKGGIIVLGTVDSSPQPAHVGPPAVAAMSTVKQVIVREGQAVKPGDPLVQFDDAIYRAKLEQAKAQAKAAELDVKLAEKAKQNHAIQLEQQEAAIKATEEQLKLVEESQRIALNRLNKLLSVPDITSGQPRTEAQKQKAREEDMDLRLLESKILELRAKAENSRKELLRLQLDPVDLKAQQARIKVEGLQGAVKEAQAAVDAMRVKADLGGVVEQLRAVEGMTYGPATREPVVTLVPAGKRIVRAEVQAEFAYKVAGTEGKKVTIYDDTNFALTYEGTVRRIATSFLPRRAADVALTVSPTKVLEVEIDVLDPAAAGKPELRVGQPVRVSFE
jgi:multidrug resistance efflux pump